MTGSRPFSCVSTLLQITCTGVKYMKYRNFKGYLKIYFDIVLLLLLLFFSYTYNMF